MYLEGGKKVGLSFYGFPYSETGTQSFFFSFFFSLENISLNKNAHKKSNDFLNFLLC